MASAPAVFPRCAGGGGITAVVQPATGYYRLSIAQEGQVDFVDDEVSVAPDGMPKIVSRKSGTRSR